MIGNEPPPSSRNARANCSLPPRRFSGVAWPNADAIPTGVLASRWSISPTTTAPRCRALRSDWVLRMDTDRTRRPCGPQVLAATGPATVAAAELHHRNGSFVSLRVGALPYPLDPSPGRTPRPSELRRELVNPAEIAIGLSGPLSIGSGQNAKHAVLLRNLSDRLIAVETNGLLTASITDPADGTIVGGLTGAQTQPLVTFTVKPGQAGEIPLLVGTASFTPELGYAVPAGSWQLTVPLDLADGRHPITPPLAITITETEPPARQTSSSTSPGSRPRAGPAPMIRPAPATWSAPRRSMPAERRPPSRCR